MAKQAKRSNRGGLGLTKRLFVAVTVDDDVRDLARRCQSALIGVGPVRWVAPEAMHITIKFLGDTEIGQLPELLAVLQESALGQKEFVAVLGGVGGFPNSSRARTLWLGVGVGAAELRLLQQQVETNLAARGFPRDERPFTPHLTIGRSRELVKLPALPNELAHERVSCPVKGMTLFESRLGRAGPNYIPLATVHWIGR